MNFEQMKALFVLSGLEILSYQELPNDYWPDREAYAEIRRNSPWWFVKTQYGWIKIGWRKRVISIHWDDTDYRSGVSTFADGRMISEITDHDVTKGETYVHAWGYADAVSILQNLELCCKQVQYAKENPEPEDDSTWSGTSDGGIGD